jgi:hypothetical protein
MSLSHSERKELEELVDMVLSVRLRQMQEGIVKGFVEALDWYSDNLANIFEARNKTLDTEFKAFMERFREKPLKETAVGFKP